MILPFHNNNTNKKLGWGNSTFALIRNIHKVFKNLALRAFFTCTNMTTKDGKKKNINWSVVGFPGKLLLYLLRFYYCFCLFGSIKKGAKIFPKVKLIKR